MLELSLAMVALTAVVPVHGSDPSWSAVEFDLQTKERGLFGSAFALELPRLEAGLHVLDDGKQRAHWSAAVAMRYRIFPRWDLWVEGRQGQTSNAAVPIDYVQASQSRVTRPRTIWREAGASLGLRRNLRAFPSLLVPYWGLGAGVSQVRGNIRLEGSALELSSESVESRQVAQAGFDSDALFGGHLRGGLSARLNQMLSGVVELRIRGRWVRASNIDGIRTALQPVLRGHLASYATLGFYLDLDL